jgi:hypothetical protein
MYGSGQSNRVVTHPRGTQQEIQTLNTVFADVTV